MDYHEHTLNPPGKRPEWLRDGDWVRVAWGGRPVSKHSAPAKNWGPWEENTSVAIPTAHPAVPCLKWNDEHPDAVPFKPWLGGDAAPADWDGGEVLFNDGHVYLHGNDWDWGETGEHGIAGYRPKPTEQTQAPSPELSFQWSRGTRVEKIKGSAWTGKVVGFYSTDLTPEGYAVESENEPGSVQIYPRAALRLAELEPKVDPLEEVTMAMRGPWTAKAFRERLDESGLAIIELAKEQK